ncbi:MAG TPA: hypothetical protein VFU42_02895 [Candidatus Deferrimicrobiaceae bacterium]|nr:hypothetical protein [Candidatus Deferrimicrobiaceae bacterium]
MSDRVRHAASVSSLAADLERASALCLRPAPGKLAGFFGTGAHRLALRALARPLLAGEAVVAVDGGNRFDPYEIGRAERALGGSGRVALSRILVSRAFTCHQMEALLSRRLGPALDRAGGRIAVVFGLPETFTDADVPFAEACRVFRNCLSSLRRLAAGGARVVLVGEGGAGETLPGLPHGLAAPPFAAVPADGGRSGFFRHLVRTADPCLLLRREGDGWKATLRAKGGA